MIPSRMGCFALVACLLCLTGCKSVPPSLANLPGVKQIGQATGLTPGDAEKIAAVMDDVERGIENRQIFKVMAHVAGTYHDAEGRTYDSIRAYLADMFKRYKTIRITRTPPKITVQENRAKVVDTFGTVAEPHDPQSDPPINMQGQVAIMLEKAGNDWLIVEWTGLL